MWRPLQGICIADETIADHCRGSCSAHLLAIECVAIMRSALWLYHSGFVTEYHLVNINIPTFPNPVLVNSIYWWITIHQKLDDSTDFNLYWSDYKAGFGIPGGNFWIGLERMHQMTSATPYRLRIELQANNNLWYSAEYDTFQIGSEAGGYAIHVTGYHGDAGDALQYGGAGYQNGMKFSTRDVDNDLWSGTPCAIESGAGSWYNNCGCFLLTGHSINNAWCTLSSVVGLPNQPLYASRMLIQKYWNIPSQVHYNIIVSVNNIILTLKIWTFNQD